MVKGSALSKYRPIMIVTKTPNGTTYDFVEKRVVPLYQYRHEERPAGTLTIVTDGDGHFAASIPALAPDHDYTVKITTTDPDGLSATACMGGGRDLRGTPEQQKNALTYMMTLIDQAVVLGCPSMIGPVYSEVGRADAVPADEYKKQWATVVKHLKTLCKHAEKKGVTVCLEPLNRFETDFINTCDQGLKMIKDVGSPALKLHLDTFHMNIEEKNQAAAIKKAGKLLAHFHACGSDRGTPGNDHIDWKPIAKALQDVKYKGDVVIESFTTDVKVIARAAAIWRRMEPTTEEIATKGIKFLRKTL